MVLEVMLMVGIATDAIIPRDCGAQQQQVSNARLQIKKDQNSLARLNLSITAGELEQWSSAAEEERQHILIETLKSGVSTFADEILTESNLAARRALRPMSIAGYDLPRGLASLGTGQTAAIIKRLQQMGADSPALIASLRYASEISGKAAKLESAGDFSRLAQQLKDAAMGIQSEDSAETAAALFQIAAGLAGKGEFAVAIGNALFEGSKNQFDAYIMSSAVDTLSDAVDLDLRAVNLLTQHIKQDVEQLQKAKRELETCQADSNAVIHAQCDDQDGLDGTWVDAERPDIVRFVFQRIDQSHYRLLQKGSTDRFQAGSGSRASFSETILAAVYISVFTETDSAEHSGIAFTASYEDYTNMGSSTRPTYKPFSKGSVNVSLTCDTLSWTRQGTQWQWYDSQGKPFEEKISAVRKKRKDN